MRVIKFCNREFKDITIKQVLFNHLNLSDKLVTDLKKSEFITVNGEYCTVRKKIGIGDTVEILIAETETSDIIPVKGNLDILYEDEDILVVNKPAKMPTHPTRYHVDDTLANLVCGYLGDGFVFRAANRLDKDTTGVVLVAKNRYSAENINRQIRSGEIVKEYVAICCGNIANSGIVEANIKKENGIKRIVSSDGQYAKTVYTPVKYENGYTFVDLHPKTGRTHQLRVHMAHIGHPIYGDFLYGKEEQSRTLLHCKSMAFNHPHTKEKMCIKTHLPMDFFINPDSSL